MKHYTHKKCTGVPSQLVKYLKIAPEWIEAASLWFSCCAGNLQFPLLIFSLSQSDLRTIHHLQEKGNKASPKWVYGEFSPSKARLEQMKFLARVSVSQKPSLGNSAAATFPVNAAFIFHSLKWWWQKANYCSLVQGCLHKTSTISPFCCMKNHNKSWFSYNSLELCFQELLRQALKDIDIQGKQILACHRNVIFF